MIYIISFILALATGLIVGFVQPQFSYSQSPTPVNVLPTITITSIIAYGPEYFLDLENTPFQATQEARLAKYKEVLADQQEGKIIMPVVMYHYIEKYVDPLDTMKRKLTVFLPEFERQLVAWKKSGYETYFAKDISRYFVENSFPGSRSVVLTFDDGYEDFYMYVFPLLKKYEMKATVYVISNYIGRQGFLTNDQLIELSKSPLVEIGGHTRNHIYLKDASNDVVKDEVISGKMELEKMINRRIDTFAYPFGAFSADAENTVHDASYSAAFTTLPGIVHASESTMLVSRIRPHLVNYNDIDTSLVRLYGQYK